MHRAKAQAGLEAAHRFWSSRQVSAQSNSRGSPLQGKPQIIGAQPCTKHVCKGCLMSE